jgi:hypothetical protein
VSLAFACNRTCVPKIGGRSDDWANLQRGLQESQKSPANRGFWVRRYERAFPRVSVLAGADNGGSPVAGTSRSPP